jgi:outer membrane protein with beta-barrel domain
MLKHAVFALSVLFLFVAANLALSRPTQAATSKGQFQLGTGVGVFAGTKGLDASFDFDVEPEYFVTEHVSISGRFDITAGGTDSVHFGARARYYFTLNNHTKWSIYVGGGAGAIIDFDGNVAGDIAIPVFGFQYDLAKHVKLGSDVSFDIVFDGDEAAFATRLMPVQFRWAF